jgi:redox-sensitive bicupin YhaK (pirin superfamily)
VITVRRARERMHTRIGWLDSRHSFTFDEHIDPRHMGFRALRVLNEDRVAPAHGFGMQPQRDMEMLTWVLEGSLRHEDSLGSHSIVKPGDVQAMSAGTGVLHSEFNASANEPLHMLQMWIAPARSRLSPRYQQRTFRLDEGQGRLLLIASDDGRQGSVAVHQDIAAYAARLDASVVASYTLAVDRYAWLQVARGRIQLNGTDLEAGDGAAITAPLTLELLGVMRSEFLLLDLT